MNNQRKMPIRWWCNDLFHVPLLLVTENDGCHSCITLWHPHVDKECPVSLMCLRCNCWGRIYDDVPGARSSSTQWPALSQSSLIAARHFLGALRQLTKCCHTGQVEVYQSYLPQDTAFLWRYDVRYNCNRSFAISCIWSFACAVIFTLHQAV